MSTGTKCLATMAFAVSRDPSQSPSLASYYPYVSRIIRFARGCPGFLREQPDLGPMANPRFLTEALKAAGREVAQALFVWDSIESLMAFSYNGIHAEALRMNHQDRWFVGTGSSERQPWPAYVLWWSEKSEVTWKAACERLEHLHDHGPTARAFTFKSPFGADGLPCDVDRARVAELRTWYQENQAPPPGA